MKFMDTSEASSETWCNTLLVDSLNLGFRFKHSNATVFAEKYVDTVRSFAKSYECNRVIITGDWGSAYRKKVLPSYKANREELRAKQTKEEAQEFIEFLNEYNRALDLLKCSYPVLKFKGVEADDIIAYICSKREEKNLGDIWIISSDGDLDQLLNENVSRFAFSSRKEFTKENWHEHHSYNLEDHLNIKCLMGDKGDNVPGVVGIGPKRAESIIKDYGSVYDIHAQLPIKSNYKYMQALNEFGDKLLTNVELMDLPEYCIEAIGKDEYIKEIEEAI